MTYMNLVPPLFALVTKWCEPATPIPHAMAIVWFLILFCNVTLKKLTD